MKDTGIGAFAGQTGACESNLLDQQSGQATVHALSRNLCRQGDDSFFGALIRDSKKKVFLVLDNLKVHHSRKVKEWLAGKEDQIELFFLPRYSPKLNPDEYLNCDLKPSISRGKPVRENGQMRTKVLFILRSLQKQPERLRSYFQAEKFGMRQYDMLDIKMPD